jgi:hypothetical protein
MPPPPIQYVAYIESVKEVALFGVADLAFWREILKGENLFPYHANDKAEILISTPQLVFMGARFNELSISIAVSKREDGSTHDGYYMAHAFNSLRFFAFSERMFFKTPYYYADVQVTERIPASFQLKHESETVFEARMDANSTLTRSKEEHFEGPVYLPGGNRYFVARISGFTNFYPFSSSDTLELKPSQHEKIFLWLLESDFRGMEWRIRGNAIHGKSKTYMRTPQPTNG